MTASNMDPFVACPYNPKHRVPRSRLQGHIVKCQINHPELKICPYNATHRYPEMLITAHCNNCPDKDAMFPEVNSKIKPLKKGAVYAPKPILQKEYISKTDALHEYWDD